MSKLLDEENNEPQRVTGTTPNFQDKLKQLKKQATKPKYANGFVLESITCHSCKNTITINAMQVFENKASLIVFAESEHSKATMLICLTPKLIIIYKPVFIDNELMK